jgi:hypothetical protein
MGVDGFIRTLVTGKSVVLITAAVAVAACATGLEPDRSSLEGIGGGASASSSADASSSGTPSSSSSSAGPGASSSSNASSASSSAGGGGEGGGVSSSTGAGGSIEDAGTDAPTPTGLRVQYKAADTNVGNAEIKAVFNIINDSPDTVTVNQLSIRYWYTIDAGAMTQAFFCDYALMTCAKVMHSFGAQMGVNADHYLELTFSGADTLAPGAQTGEIQSRFNKTDFSVFNEANDYSFDPTKTMFVDWDKVTLYHNGTLVWGVEP